MSRKQETKAVPNRKTDPASIEKSIESRAREHNTKDEKCFVKKLIRRK